MLNACGDLSSNEVKHETTPSKSSISLKRKNDDHEDNMELIGACTSSLRFLKKKISGSMTKYASQAIKPEPILIDLTESDNEEQTREAPPTFSGVDDPGKYQIDEVQIIEPSVSTFLCTRCKMGNPIDTGRFVCVDMENPGERGHAVCADCVRHLAAKAADLDYRALPSGGTGICCFVFDCYRILRFEKMAPYLTQDIHDRLHRNLGYKSLLDAGVDFDTDTLDTEENYEDCEIEFDHSTCIPKDYVPNLPQPEEDGKFRFECAVCFEKYSLDEGMARCEDFFGEGSSVDHHMVCVDCIRGWAAAAVGEATLPPGGIGLRCVDNKCKNVILMKEFEMYLAPDVHETLVKRLQNECIVAAELPNLVTCTKCGYKATFEQEGHKFWCRCGFVQCMKCNLVYHEGKTCEDVQKELLAAGKIDDIVLRKCEFCHAQFIKDSGCNKVTCRCGKLYCYVCRKVITDGYDHFCNCRSTLTSGTVPCASCKRSCLLWEQAELRDRKQIEQLALTS